MSEHVGCTDNPTNICQRCACAGPTRALRASSTVELPYRDSRITMWPTPHTELSVRHKAKLTQSNRVSGEGAPVCGA